MGLYTLNGGLELAGSPLSASRIAEATGLGPEPVTAAQAPADAPPVATTDGRQTVIVTARTGSYSPPNLQIASGLPTTLIVRSDDAQGCVRAFIIRDKQYILPVRGDTSIDLGVLTPGRLGYSCGMGMYTGTHPHHHLKGPPMTTITLQVDGMHCASCGLLVDDTLEDLPGVLRAEIRLREGRTTVQVDPDRCTPAQVVAAIAEAGYPAQVIEQ